MACALTSSRTLACRDAVGGIKKIYITELANKNAITASAGAISAFSLTTGKQFWTYDLVKETAEYEQKINTSVEAGTVFYETELKVMLHKTSVATRNELKLIAQNQLMIIILDRNGDYWLMGESNGADLVPSTSKSGKAMGDFNGYELVFNAKESDLMQTVASGLIATLTAPAV
jgi:hypothetical protein